MVVKQGEKEFAGIIARIDGILARLRSKNAPLSDICFWLATQNYYRRAHEANIEGKPLALNGLFGPRELLAAMDIPFYSAENHGIFVVQSQPDIAEKLFDRAESYGLSSDICSPHRAAFGLALEGMMPRPTFVFSTSSTCDQTLKLYELFQEFYRCPAFLFDNPYTYGKDALDYARKEAAALIVFLEEQTGRKLDYGRLREVLELSKTAHDYWEKISNLRKKVPCPINGRESLKDFSIMITSCGTQEAVDYFKARYDEVALRVAQGRGVLEKEKHRIAWLYVLPLFDLRIADWLEEKYGAVIVVDNWAYMMPGIELDPSAPLDFLAKRDIRLGFFACSYMEDRKGGLSIMMAELCRDFQADMAVVLAHLSCNQYCGAIKLMKDEIARKVGIPFFVLDGDILDGRVLSSPQMKGRLEEYLAVMEGR